MSAAEGWALHDRIPSPGASPLLTDEELEAIELMGRVADLLAVIVAPGATAEQDTLELHHHVHAIQRAIGSQAAARAYPQRFRQLGDVGAWNEATS